MTLEMPSRTARAIVLGVLAGAAAAMPLPALTALPAYAQAQDPAATPPPATSDSLPPTIQLDPIAPIAPDLPDAPPPSAPVETPPPAAAPRATPAAEQPATSSAEPQAPPEGQPPATPPPASDRVRRAPRAIKIDDLKLDPKQYLISIPPIDSSIVLNLKKVEREPERRWSLHFSFGATQADLAQSVARARLMERFGREAFGELQSGAFDIGWTRDGPTDPGTGLRLQGDIRYKLNSLVTLEGRLGQASAITAFAQRGFRFDEKAEILDLSGSVLLTMPWRLWRFGFYAGGGGGYLHGKLSTGFYVPSFSGIPFYLVSSATGNSSQYHLRGGGEMYVTRFVSFTVEGEYRRAEIETLKYSSDSQAKAVDEYDGPGGVGNSPHVWNYYDFDLEQQRFFWSVQDPDRPDLPLEPVTIDFTGFSFTAGLRYHF
jgi:hypothetical protein